MNVTTAELRGKVAEIIQRVSTQKTRAVISRYGEPQAMIVCLEEVAELDRLRRIFSTRVVQHSHKVDAGA